jgi:hypothetical protein
MFPTFSNTHDFHLFDPKFIYEPGVDYSRCKLNEKALNSTTCTIDAYCSEHNIDAIEFLKIDTDGYDIDVLKGATKMIQQTKYIQVEYDIFYLFKKQNVEDLYNLLKGFNIYKITPFGLEAVGSIKEDYIYANYLFIREANLPNYEPHTLDVEFFKKTFFELPGERVEQSYRTATSPFFDNDACQIDEKRFMVSYFSQYLPGFVNSLS